MIVTEACQTAARRPQGRLPARSDAIFAKGKDRMSEDIARRMACGKQK